MSPLMRKSLADAWLVWVEHAQIRAFRRDSWRRGAAFRLELTEPVGPAAPHAWIAACEAVCAQVRQRWPVALTVALPQSLTPCFDVALDDRKMPAPVIDAYLRARLEQVHGLAPHDWQICCDPRVKSGCAVAFACEAATVQRLAALRTAMTRVRIIPAACWGAERALSVANAKNRSAFTGWYVHAEADRHVALWTEAGRVSHLALLPLAPVDNAETLLQLAPWERRFALRPDGTSVLIGEPTDQPMQVRAQSLRPIIRLGLFAEAPKTSDGRAIWSRVWA